MENRFLQFHTEKECQGWIDILNPKMGYPKDKKSLTYTVPMELTDGSWACLICDECVSLMGLTEKEINGLKTSVELGAAGLDPNAEEF